MLVSSWPIHVLQALYSYLMFIVYVFCLYCFSPLMWYNKYSHHFTRMLNYRFPRVFSSTTFSRLSPLSWFAFCKSLQKVHSGLPFLKNIPSDVESLPVQQNEVLRAAFLPWYLTNPVYLFPLFLVDTLECKTHHNSNCLFLKCKA